MHGMEAYMTTLASLPFILFMVVVVTAIAENINVPYPLLTGCRRTGRWVYS